MSKHIVFITDTITSVYLYCNSINVAFSDIYETKIIDFSSKKVKQTVTVIDKLTGNLLSGFYITRNNWGLHEMKGSTVTRIGMFHSIAVNTPSLDITKRFKQLCSHCSESANIEAIQLFEDNLDGYLSDSSFSTLFKLVLFYDNLEMAKYIFSKDGLFNHVIKRTFVVSNAFSDACIAEELEMGEWLTQINKELDNKSDLNTIENNIIQTY